MNIISEDTIYTEVSLADEERGLLLRLLREEHHRQWEKDYGVVAFDTSAARRQFINGIIEKLEVK